MAQTTINNLHHTFQAAVIVYLMVPVLMACLLRPETENAHFHRRAIQRDS